MTTSTSTAFTTVWSTQCGNHTVETATVLRVFHNKDAASRHLKSVKCVTTEIRHLDRLGQLSVQVCTTPNSERTLTARWRVRFERLL